MKTKTATALVLGIASMTGGHLAEALIKLGYTVHGAKRANSCMKNLSGITDELTLHDIELLDISTLQQLLSTIQPDQIYMLISAPQSASIEILSEINLKGTWSLLESMRLTGCQGRLVFIGSSAIYGVTPAGENRPVDEETPPKPTSDYGLAKLLQEELVRHYSQFNLSAVLARPSNLIGPHQRSGLVCSDYAEKIIRIERGEQKPVLTVHGHENIRDFLDVRDAVSAYIALAEQGTDGEIYNVSSGVGWTINHTISQLANLSHIPLQTEFISDGSANCQICSNDKIRSELGWKPMIPLEQSLQDQLNHQRSRHTSNQLSEPQLK